MHNRATTAKIDYKDASEVASESSRCDLLKCALHVYILQLYVTAEPLVRFFRHATELFFFNLHYNQFKDDCFTVQIARQIMTFQRTKWTENTRLSHAARLSCIITYFNYIATSVAGTAKSFATSWQFPWTQPTTNWQTTIDELLKLRPSSNVELFMCRI